MDEVATPPAGVSATEASIPASSDDAVLADTSGAQPSASAVLSESTGAAEVSDEDATDFPGEDEGIGWSTKMSTAAAAGFLQTKRFLTRMLPDSSGEEVATGIEEGLDDLADEPSEGESPPLGGRSEPADEIELHPPPGEELFSPEAEEGTARPKSVPPPLPEIEPYTAPAPASGTRARLFVLLALVILIVVPAVVAAVYWGEGESRRVQAEQLTEAARAQLEAAETALNSGDKVSAREHLVDAKDYIGEVIALDGSNPQRNDIVFEIEQMLSDVLQVQPLYGLNVPLLTFPTDARPHRVLVADSSIYVLDSGQQAVLRYRYDPSANEVTDERPQTVLQQGRAIDGVTVGTLADMAWLPLIPGFEDKPTLLILDRNNNLFSYDPRVEGARRLEMSGQDQWRSASQVQTYNGRTYIADEGANQIFRYTPGQEELPPDEWFTEETLVNLAGTIAMEIDGDIWLLLGSGNIMRYRGGEQLPYSLENSLGLAEEPVDMYVTTEDRNQIYLADAGEDRILVYDKNGAYEKQLRAAEGDPLRGLSGIFIDETAQRLFLLTKSSLYSHPLL